MATAKRKGYIPSTIGPGVTPARTASDVSNDMMDNVVKSMTPQTGKVDTVVQIGQPSVVQPSVPIAETPSPSRAYTPSARVSTYQSRLSTAENAPKPQFESKYDSSIQSILDGILNRKSFDLNKDPNYQTLYDQYAQSYMAQGNRAMRDQLGASAALTGGYGSTAAQAAAGQAYDNYLQGLNDRNMQLMQLAYQMYGDETADRYNQLGAVTGLDNTDYARYRDDVSDWLNDRNYWADRYQTEFGNDYGMYSDDRAYDTQADQTDYQRYQDALALAMQYAQRGMGVPSYIAKTITDYTGAADINDVVAAMPINAGGSGGSDGRRGSDSSNSEELPKSITQDDFNVDYNAVYATTYQDAIASGKTRKQASTAARKTAHEYLQYLEKQGVTIEKPVYKNASDLKRAEYDARKRAARE